MSLPVLPRINHFFIALLSFSAHNLRIPLVLFPLVDLFHPQQAMCPINEGGIGYRRAFQMAHALSRNMVGELLTGLFTSEFDKRVVQELFCTRETGLLS